MSTGGVSAPPVTERGEEAARQEAADLATAAAVGDIGDAAAAELEREVPESLFRTADEEAAGLHRVTIQVWDRVEGAAAVDAEVFVMHSAEADWTVTRGPFAQHWSKVAEARGRRFRTDDEGRVEVPGFARDSVVVAKASAAYAFKWVGEVGDDGHVEILTLQSDESVTIRVVDEQGAPVAGAAVGIVERFPVMSDLEELQARAAQLEEWVAGMRQWMSENPSMAGQARGKFDGLQNELGEARASAELARAESERQRVSGAQQRPLARREVRTRRLTDENGLAVIDHFQLYRRSEEREAKEKSAGKATAKKSAAGAKGAGRARGASRGKGAGRGDASAKRGNGGGKDGKGGGKDGKGGGKGGQSWSNKEAGPTTFEAALLMPLTTPVTKEISVDPVPEGVIELRKPPTAALALRTVDRDGRPFTHPVRGQLELISDQSAEWSRVMLRKEQNERTIEFPHVGLGLMFAAGCRLDDEDFSWRSEELRGPVAAGERVEVDLVVAPDAGMLFAKLVNAAGAPLAGVKPSFLISARGGRLEGEEVITDDAGRFHLPYKVRPGQVAPYRFEVRLDDDVPTRGFASPLAQLPLATVTDLGEISLDGLAEFVRGVVVDDSGAPVVDANVQLERERFSDDGEKQRADFVDEPFVRTTTGEDGAFQLFGDFEPGRYRLRVEKRDHFRTYVTGANWSGAEVRAELVRKCRIVGTVIAPEWMDRKRCRVDLRPVSVSAPAGEEVGPREDQLHDHQGKTYAYFDWVRPGIYDVSFRLQGYPEAFLVIDRVVLEPGQVGIHPRLQDLDLGSYIFRFEIYPVDQNGEPVSVNKPQLTKITRRDGSQQFLGLVMKGDFGEVFNTSPQLEVLPMMNGYVADTQVLSPGRSELVFRRVPPVDVVLYGLSAMTDGLPTHVLLERLEMDGRPETLEAFDGMSKRISGWYARAKYTLARLDDMDTARVGVTGDGPHKVVLRIGPMRRDPQTVELDAIDVELVPGGDPLRVVVPFDPVVVQQAIDLARAAAESAGQGSGK